MTKRRHFGSIRKLPSNRYQARYRGPDGRSHTGERTFASKTDAQRYLTAIESQMYGGTWAEPHRREVLLGDYADDWLAHRPLEATTYVQYERLIRVHIKPELGATPIGRLTPDDVRRWYTGRLRNTGNTTARQAYARLRTILGTAVSDGIIAKNPCTIPGAGAVPKVERQMMTREQADQLIAAMPEDMRILVILSLAAHVRRGELLGLRRGDVDLRDGVLHIRTNLVHGASGVVEKSPKNGETRSVLLEKEVVDLLRAHMAADGPADHNERLFKHRSGGELKKSHIRYAWDRARQSTGLTQFTWHGLRAAGLTWYSQEGATAAETARRGGHKDIRAALGYQLVEPGRERELAARFVIPKGASALASSA